MKYVQSGIHPNIKIHPKTGIRYYRKGQLEFSLLTSDDQQAYDRMVDELAKLDGTGTLAKRIRLKSLYPEYKYYKESQTKGELEGRKKIRPGTLREIKYVFESHLLPFFGNMKLSDIDEVKWERYCQKATVSDLTNHRKVFSTFLKWCKKQGYLKSLPDITDIPVHKRRKRRILRPNEILTLLTNAENRLLIIIACGLFMGMRIGEIVSLSWDRINLIEKYLILFDDHVKTDDGREIPINEFVLKLLIKERARQEELGIKTRFVFYNRHDLKRHTHSTTFGCKWRKLIEDCGFEKGSITPHDLRATWEKYSNKSTHHTDTQREKMAGASIDVQRKIYVSMTHEDLRGLENVVRVEGLDRILDSKIGSVN